MANHDWAAVYKRCQQAIQAASEALAASQAELGDALMLGVRRHAVRASARTPLPGAQRRAPAQVADRVAARPGDREIVVC